MRIQFEIKEQLPEIIAEIFSSDKWLIIVKEEHKGLKRIEIKDPVYDSKADIDIWETEVHIKTAWSNYTYRIFETEQSVICEYIGAYRGLLEQILLPQLTPRHNILDIEVLDTSIATAKKETLRHYGTANVQLKKFRGEAYQKHARKTSEKEHPTVVYDQFIKEGIPVPSCKDIPAKEKK